jgi:Tfp pilus assembly protein PilV
MKRTSVVAGFSTVELLITLFVAAVFLAAGYQLYLVTVRDSGDVRQRARASAIAYDYLRRNLLKRNFHTNRDHARSRRFSARQGIRIAQLRTEWPLQPISYRSNCTLQP